MALMVVAASMLLLKGLKEQGCLGRFFGKVTIRDQPPSNTIQKIVALKEAMATLPKEVALKLLDAVDDSNGAFEDGHVVDRKIGKCGLDKVILPPRDKCLAFQDDNFFFLLSTTGFTEANGETKVGGWGVFYFAPQDVSEVMKEDVIH